MTTTTDTPRTDDQFRDTAKMVPTDCCNSAPEKRLADGIRYWDCAKCGATVWIENPVKDHFRSVTKLVTTVAKSATHPDKCIGNVTHFIELKRLYQSMPKHLQKKVSCHDLKLICDAYNGDQPPIDNQFVADGCEKFAPAPEEPSERAEAEVERLVGRMKEAEDLIKGLHDGWKKARKAHLETCKNAQTEIDKLHAENVCLQELLQEFYEWSRRDYPTEQEVREIMDRFYDLLNK